MKYIFGPDCWRDNEYERARLAEAIEWLEGCDDVKELDTESLERIMQASKAEGSNEAAVKAGQDAQDELNSIAEREYERRYSSDTGRFEDSQSYRQSMTDAGRQHLLP